jgi:hypothetical protein
MIKISDIRRIELAVQQKDRMELQWAATYCKMRLNLASGSHHVKYWGLFGRMVSEAIAEQDNACLHERKAA